VSQLLRVEDISYTMGTRVLPDIYALARGPQHSYSWYKFCIYILMLQFVLIFAPKSVTPISRVIEHSLYMYTICRPSCLPTLHLVVWVIELNFWLHHVSYWWLDSSTYSLLLCTFLTAKHQSRHYCYGVSNFMITLSAQTWFMQVNISILWSMGP